MNQVKRMRAKISTKSPMNHPFENHITRPGSGHRRSQRQLAIPLKNLAETKHRPGHELVINEMEVDALGDWIRLERVTTADLADEGDVNIVALRKRLG